MMPKHGGKNIGKKVIAAAKVKGNEDLSLWTSAVRNHFWYCSKTCDGNVDDLKDLWIGILHHVVDEHMWILGDGKGEGRCGGHGVLPEEERQKPWLTNNSSAQNALHHIVLNKRFFNTLSYYTNFRHTGFLESLHNHLLMYCPKRHSYTFVGYKLRNQLAAIDFNKHTVRQLAKTPDGKPMYKAQYSKRTKTWRPVNLLKPKEYAYIPNVLPGPVNQKLNLAADDPRNIARSIAATPRPEMEQLVQSHQSRFSN